MRRSSNEPRSKSSLNLISPSCIVSLMWSFDFDDLCTQIGQGHGTIGTGQNPAEVKNADTAQWRETHRHVTDQVHVGSSAQGQSDFADSHGRRTSFMMSDGNIHKTLVSEVDIIVIHEH